MKAILKTLLTITVICVAAWSLAGCSSKAAEDAVIEENIILLGDRDVVMVESGSLTTGVTITGSLEPYKTVNITAQVPGTIRNLRVDRGQTVSQGSVIAIIEAEAIRQQATGAQSAVAAAEAGLLQSQRQLQSAETLHSAGAMSDIDYNGVKTAYEAAKSQVEMAKVQMTAASEQARKTSVVAPITGVISDRSVEEGEAVNPGQPLLKVVNTSQLELYGQVPVSQVSRIKIGQEVVFTMDAYPGRSFKGSVSRIEPTADPQTRQVGVYLTLPNNDRSLVGGLFASGRIIGNEIKDALTIPATSVRRQGEETSVYIIDKDRVERRVVVITAEDDLTGRVAVGSGLNSGDRVLISPSADVPEGALVRLASTDSVSTAQSK